MKRLSETERQSILFRLEVILATLLIVLISVALVYVLIRVLERFGNVIVLFTLGAIVVYILNPAVNKVTALLGKRWAGMLAVYGGIPPEKEIPATASDDAAVSTQTYAPAGGQQ